jgi:preprotein translocase subunit YajC
MLVEKIEIVVIVIMIIFVVLVMRKKQKNKSNTDLLIYQMKNLVEEFKKLKIQL